MDVLDSKLGPEGNIEVDVKDGKLIVKIKHEHASGYVSLEAAEDLKYFLEKLKPKLPEWAQIGINVAESALP